jgi:hypothetical protein
MLVISWERKFIWLEMFFQILLSHFSIVADIESVYQARLLAALSLSNVFHIHANILDEFFH